MSGPLVIGASGLVGASLLGALAEAGQPAAGTCYQHARPDLIPLDVRDRAAVVALVESLEPGVIYLPAALSNVDYCERQPDEAYEINVQGLCNVVAVAGRVGARLVYFSSDYVFDGRGGPYREDDPARPVGEYGRQKLIAEHYLGLHAPDSLIVRTTVVYGWESQGKNFVARLIRTLEAGQTLRAPADQIGSPTYTPDLARAVIDLVATDARGVYHVAGRERIDRYGFAIAAAEAFGLDPHLVEPVSTAELGQAAPRPLDAGLVVEKAERRLGRPLLGYREGLAQMERVRIRLAPEGGQAWPGSAGF